MSDEYMFLDVFHFQMNNMSRNLGHTFGRINDKLSH